MPRATPKAPPDGWIGRARIPEKAQREILDALNLDLLPNAPRVKRVLHAVTQTIQNYRTWAAIVEGEPRPANLLAELRPVLRATGRARQRAHIHQLSEDAREAILNTATTLSHHRKLFASLEGRAADTGVLLRACRIAARDLQRRESRGRGPKHARHRLLMALAELFEKSYVPIPDASPRMDYGDFVRAVLHVANIPAPTPKTIENLLGLTFRPPSRTT